MRFRPDTRARRSRTLQKAADLAAQDGRVLALLADVMLAVDDPQALSIAEKAATLATNDAIVQSVLALAYGKGAQWEKAKQAAQAAAKLDPKLARAYHALGKVYFATADRVQAQAALEQAVKLEPKALRWRPALAAVLETGEENGPALREFDAVIKLVPDYPRALIHFSLASSPRTATRQLAKDKLTSRPQRSPPLHGKPGWRKGISRPARRTTRRRSHTTNGDWPWRRTTSRSSLAMADAQTENGDCRQAKDLIEKQLDCTPTQAGLHTQFAYAQACLEDYRKA